MQTSRRKGVRRVKQEALDRAGAGSILAELKYIQESGGML